MKNIKKTAVKLYQLYRLLYYCFNDGCLILKIVRQEFSVFLS